MKLNWLTLRHAALNVSLIGITLYATNTESVGAGNVVLFLAAEGAFIGIGAIDNFNKKKFRSSKLTDTAKDFGITCNVGRVLILAWFGWWWCAIAAVVDAVGSMASLYGKQIHEESE